MVFDAAKKLQQRAKCRLGLDIGTNFVKMAEISEAGEKAVLKSCGLKKIKGLERQALVESIRSLASELKVQSSECAISLSGTSLVARLLSMPKMTKDELTGAVRFEIEKFIPFDINECIMDFQVQLGENRDKSDMDVLVAAAKKEVVTAKISIVQESGFSIQAVDVDIFAVVNAFLRNFPEFDHSKTAALINIGASSANLVIIRSGVVLFVRDVSIGTNFFESEVLRKCSVNIDLEPGVEKIPEDKRTHVDSCIKVAVISLMDEIKLSFGYYENQSGRSIDELYISGGGAGLSAIEKALNDAFLVKPILWNPFSFLNSAENASDKPGVPNHLFAVAVGLSLR